MLIIIQGQKQKHQTQLINLQSLLQLITNQAQTQINLIDALITIIQQQKRKKFKSQIKIAEIKTMLSQFSKAKGDTVSHSGKPSNSRFQQSAHSSRTLDTNPSIDLSIQNLIPLIESIKEQNEQIKQEKQLLEKELKQLAFLSESVLAQNTQMRKHYQNRTSDIKKVISTISLNMNEQLEDLNHLNHMVRENNYQIVKRIQNTMKQVHESDQYITELHTQLDRLGQNNSSNQQQVIRRKVKIRQLQSRLNQLTLKNQRQNNVLQLQNQVDILLKDVTNLRNQNIHTLKSAKSQQFANQSDRPHLTAENINIIQSIKAYKKQMDQMKQDSDKFQKANRNLEELNKKAYSKYLQCFKQRQKLKSEVQKKEEEISNMKKNILEKKKSVRESQTKKSELEDQKYNLAKILAKKKQAIRALKDNQKFDIQAMNESHRQQIGSLNFNHYQQTSKHNDQILLKINPELQNKEGVVDELKEEFNNLINQIQEMKRKVQKMDNPVKEIMRAQHQLKKIQTQRKN